jgi:hypothetical protein
MTADLAARAAPSIIRLLGPAFVGDGMTRAGLGWCEMCDAWKHERDGRCVRCLSEFTDTLDLGENAIAAALRRRNR